MSARNGGRDRVQVRQSVLIQRVIMPEEGNDAPPLQKRRTNRHGWKNANEERFRRGKQNAERMAHRWQRAGLLFSRKRGLVVATVSGTTRAAVYQRMYRYRHAFYTPE